MCAEIENDARRKHLQDLISKEKEKENSKHVHFKDEKGSNLCDVLLIPHRSEATEACHCTCSIFW